MAQDKYEGPGDLTTAEQQAAASQTLAAAMGQGAVSETESGLTDTEQNLNRTGLSEEIDDQNFLAMNDQA